ncbi:MAG TPA: class I poly(R)-hydroxyalkanoic acid synthase [Burkholderiales bacterium]|nr:class I poly(R)-hydroxyalkanoic acid synthase [Burkholderiales bacterium]
MSAPPNSPNAFEQLAAAGQAVVADFLSRLPATGPADFAALARQITAGTAAQRERFRKLEEAFYRDHAKLWSDIIGGDAAAPADADARFGAPEWNDLPFFRYLREAWRLNARFLADLGEIAELESAARHRLRFVLRQFADAVSPANFPATNPEVIRLAAESGGASLARGLQHLAGDLRQGRISMTDEAAFEVGRNVATTPGTIVAENEVMQLIQYAPATDKVRELPLLIVPPFINKYYILDLQPQNSFVRFCVERGFTTFIVSWRNVPAELGLLSWEDYVRLGVLEPLRAVLSICGASRANTLGFCVGGTLLATALAVMARKGPLPVESLTLLATLLDFSDTGDISVYVNREYVEQAERDYAAPGVMHGSRLAATFASLRANDLVWRFVIDNYLKGREPPAFDLLYWNADGANVPGRLYAYYLRNMYLENHLRQPGRLTACGEPVDLGAIGRPAYVLATREDHIVPWQTAFASVGLLGPRTEFVLGASGHVAGIVNPASKNRRHYWTGTTPAADAQTWLDNAAQHPGSWWQHWAQWLEARSGGDKPAPPAPGNDEFPAIEPAPGRYVREKSG